MGAGANSDPYVRPGELTGEISDYLYGAAQAHTTFSPLDLVSEMLEGDFFWCPAGRAGKGRCEHEC